MTIEIPKELLSDPGWRGAMFILSAPLFEYKGLARYVDLTKHTFHYTRMLKECRVFSSGEYLLLKVAVSLFNQDTKVNLWNLVNTLDSRNLQVAVDAIRFAAGAFTMRGDQ